jgi:hypothetical protein
MLTEADFRGWLLSTNDYRLQDILCRACGCTAQNSDSASAHQLGKYNHCRETYVLGVNKWDYMQLTYTIDDYRRLRMMPAAEAVIHAESGLKAPLDSKSWAEALCHPDDSDNDLLRDIRATRMDGRGSRGSEVAVRRIWKQFRRFLLFLCFLLFSSLLHLFSSLLIGFRPSTNGVGMGFYRPPMEVEFPRVLDPPKGCHWAIPIGCGTYGFVRLRI